MPMQKKGLGRGLSALIPGAAESHSRRRDGQFDLEKSPSIGLRRVRFSRGAVSTKRKSMNSQSSIRNQGIIQPLDRSPQGRWLRADRRRAPLARRDARRLEPSARAWSVTPATMRRCNSPWWKISSAKISIPSRKPAAIVACRRNFTGARKRWPRKLARAVRRSPIRCVCSHLPTEVQQEVAAGNLPAGQARALLGLHTEPLIISACREVIAKGLSTRETERMVRTP